MTVTVPADATNVNVDDLVADINAALGAAGLGSQVLAGKSGGTITLATKGLTISPLLTITIPPAKSVCESSVSESTKRR